MDGNLVVTVYVKSGINEFLEAKKRERRQGRGRS